MSRKDLETVEPWRSALREGDPALGAPDLDQQETARMRRALLAAAQEQPERPEKPRPLPWLTPAWGGAVAGVAAAAVLLLALGLWWLPEPLPEQVAVHDPAPAPPAPLPLPPAEPEQEAPGASVPERPAVAPPPILPPVPVADPPAPEPVAEMALAELPELPENTGPEPDWLGIPEEPAAGEGEDLQRQVQFATPGGTRVIWMLGPETDSTPEATPMGPEEKTE